LPNILGGATNSN